jgi:hypothetical protein
MSTTARITLLLFAITAAAQGCTVEFDESLLHKPDTAPPDAAVDAPADGPDVDTFSPDLIAPDLPPKPDQCVGLTCKGNNLFGCGQVVEVCNLGCVTTPSPRCRRMLPSNNVPAPIMDQTKDLKISSSGSLDACTGKLNGNSISGANFSTQSQVGGPKLGILRLRSFTLTAGDTLAVTGACALVVVADQVVEIGGTLDLRGGGPITAPTHAAGPGGGEGAHGTSTAATGCGGGKSSDPQHTGGGGGGAHFGAGGAGGTVTTSGEGGKTCGDSKLVPLVGGSGGGRGGCGSKPCTVAGDGGGGGGALALVAGGAVKLQASGGINAGGGGGEGGLQGKSGGGGAGSGGSILIEAPTVTLDSAAILACGGGGGGGIDNAKPTSGRGAQGELGTNAAAGGVSLGGAGSSGSSSSGAAGGATSGVNASGGGGGGGQGRIRINTQSGSTTLPSKVHGDLTQSKIIIN